MQKYDCKVVSKRNTLIPCSVVIPEHTGEIPLILLTHGLCAAKGEKETFTMVAEKLAELGFGSICCDFAGCGQSEEDLIAYTLESCQDDLDCIVQFMKNNYCIDESRIGMIGYGMGGRIALHYTQKHANLRTIALWAPVVTNDPEGLTEGLHERMNPILEITAESKTNPAILDANDFDRLIKQLGMEFWQQMLNGKLNRLFREFDGNCIMIYGDADTAIAFDELQRIMETADKRANFIMHAIRNIDYGFGAWTNRPEQMEELINETVSFMERNL